MKKIFVNLKRFDVPKARGGICVQDHPRLWIEGIMEDSIKLGLGMLKEAEVIYFLPESLIISALEKLSAYPFEVAKAIKIGCQSVFREDITVGGNFGAFTTNRPAAAMRNLGCSWTIIGHSEERKDKLGIIAKYESEIAMESEKRRKASRAVNDLINEEIACALSAGLNVLYCVGETAEEKGAGEFEDQKPRIEDVLNMQLLEGLMGIDNKLLHKSIVIAYEPVWAIGPGKVPPGSEYIGFVSAYIKKVVNREYGFDPMVVYGGGLKEENAGMISGIDAIDGGLIALTRFSGEIGFYTEDLKKIIDKYLE